MSTNTPPLIEPKTLLDAVLRRDLTALSVDTGISAPRLTQLALHAIEDPQVIEAHPAECRQLAARRDAARTARSARGGH
jgi:hypothetical protein